MTAPNLKDSVEARLWFFNLAGLLAAMLLGCAVGPAIPPFFWLAAARLPSAVLLLMLPPTTLGRFRPYLFAASLLCLLLTQAVPTAHLLYHLTAGLLFLLIDPSLDALLAQRCPEEEWLGRMGQLLTARMAGLLLGLALSAPLLNNPTWARYVYSGILLGLILLFAAIKEEPEPSARPSYRTPRLETLKDTVQGLAQPAVLQSLTTLLAVAVLAGGSAAAFYPVPMLSDTVLRTWLNSPGLPLGLAAGCAVLAVVLERLPRQTLRAVCYGATLLFLTAHLARPAEQGFVTALELALGLALLVAHRHSLAAQPGVDSCLRGTVPVLVWTAGLAGGEALRGTSLLTPSRAASAAVLLVSLVATLRHWKSPAPIAQTHVLEQDRPGEGRHGDRTFDFAAAPESQKRRTPRWLSHLWHYLSVRFPVTLTLIVLGSFLLAGTWQASDNKARWEKQTRGAWIAIQTQLFLTSLKLRTEEEMLASSRVPTDWPAFIAANFQLDGRPMKDRDFWGTPLDFEVLPKEVRIVSAGADRKMDTPDDLERFAKRPDGVVDP